MISSRKRKMYVECLYNKCHPLIFLPIPYRRRIPLILPLFRVLLHGNIDMEMRMCVWVCNAHRSTSTHCFVSFVHTSITTVPLIVFIWSDVSLWWFLVQPHSQTLCVNLLFLAFYNSLVCVFILTHTSIFIPDQPEKVKKKLQQQNNSNSKK